jgi:hypothetical protein
MFSFIIFTLAQALFPIFNLGQPSPALAGSQSVTWATKGDFENNLSTVNQVTTRDKIIARSEGGLVLSDTGTGADGDVTISSNFNINTTVRSGKTHPDGFVTTLSAPVNQGASSITLSSAPSGSFVSGDEILISRPQELAPKYETLRIAPGYSPGSTTIPLASVIATSGGFASGTMVQRIPNYNNLTINSGFTFTANSWNGSTGGVIMFRVKNTLTNNGNINASALVNITNATFNGGGGHGGLGGNDAGSGGGGGTYGNPNNPMLFGRSGSTDLLAPGLGGGVINISSFEIINNGFIVSNGSNGVGISTDDGGSGSGGGSGGSIYVKTGGSLTGANKIGANGGEGGWGGYDCGGGGGSGGRIRAESVPQLTSGPSVVGGGGGATGDYCGAGSPGGSGTITYALPASPLLGTLGGATVGNVGLRVDAESTLGVGSKIKASTLNWLATTNANGQKVLFKIRSGDTQSELEQSLCYGPTSSDTGCADWITAGKFFSEINEVESEHGILSAIPTKRYVEVLVRLESDGSSSPILNSVTLSYDGLESPNITPKKSDGSTLDSQDGSLWTNESTLKIEAADITCVDCNNSTDRYIEAQVSTSSEFTSPITANGNVQSEGNPSVATISGLSAGSTYYVRARSLDAQGRASGWTVYSDTIKVEQSPPTGTISINSGANYATSTSVTLTLSATDTGGSSPAKTNLTYRLSNSGNENDWTTWTAYPGNDTVTNWDLTQYGGNADDGTKNVYVQYRDNAGNVSGEFQTSQADFNTGTYNSSQIGTSTNALKLIGPGGGGFTNTAYLNGGGSFSSSPPTGATLLCASDYYNETFPIYAKVGNGAQALFDTFSSFEYGDNVVTKTLSIPGGESTSISVDGGCGNYSIFTLPAGYKFTGSSLNLTLSLSFFDNSYDEVVYINYGSDTKAVGTIAETLPESSTYTSKIFGSDAAKAFGALRWNSLESGGSSIAVQFRAGNDNTPDDGTGDWTVWSTNLVNGSGISAYNNKKYFQYRVVLTSGSSNSVSPELYDITIEAGVSDSITLDTKAPANATNLQSFAGQGGAELNHDTWGQVSNPYFTWNAVTTNIEGGSENVAGYKYCFSTDQNCTPTTETTNTNFQASITNQGMHYFKVVAYDEAGLFTNPNRL